MARSQPPLHHFCEHFYSCLRIFCIIPSAFLVSYSLPFSLQIHSNHFVLDHKLTAVIIFCLWLHSHKLTAVIIFCLWLHSAISHPHVVQLLGVCLEDTPKMILLELMDGGNLLSYLQEHQPGAVSQDLSNVTGFKTVKLHCSHVIITLSPKYHHLSP